MEQSHKITKYHLKSLEIPRNRNKNTPNHTTLHEILTKSKEITPNHTKQTIPQNHRISLEITRNR